MKYYVAKVSSIFGPFSLEDFKSLDIKIFPETFIWHDALDGWKEAKEISELKEIVDYSTNDLNRISTPTKFISSPSEEINSTKSINTNIQHSDKIITKGQENNKKKQIGIAVVIIIFVVGSIAVYIQNNPSACDCANLYNNSPMSKEYTARQLNDGDFLRREADEYVEKAKKCAGKYGELDDMEKELARTATEMTFIPKLDNAIENAKKECNK